MCHGMKKILLTQIKQIIKCKTYLFSDTWCKGISTDMFHNLGNKM